MHISRRAPLAGAAPVSSSDLLRLSVVYRLDHGCRALSLGVRMECALWLLQRSRRVGNRWRHGIADGSTRALLAEDAARSRDRGREAGPDGCCLPVAALPHQPDRIAASRP